MIYICSPLIDVDYFWIPVKKRKQYEGSTHRWWSNIRFSLRLRCTSWNARYPAQKKQNTPRIIALRNIFRYCLLLMNLQMTRVVLDSQRCCMRSTWGGGITWSALERFRSSMPYIELSGSMQQRWSWNCYRWGVGSIG